MVDDITKLAKRALEVATKPLSDYWECKDCKRQLLHKDDAVLIVNARTLLPQLATAYLELKEKYGKIEQFIEDSTRGKPASADSVLGCGNEGDIYDAGWDNGYYECAVGMAIILKSKEPK